MNQFEYMKKVNDLVLNTLKAEPPKDTTNNICMECGQKAGNEKIFVEHGLCERCWNIALGFNPIEYDLRILMKHADIIFQEFQIMTDSLKKSVSMFACMAKMLVKLAKEQEAVRKGAKSQEDKKDE